MKLFILWYNSASHKKSRFWDGNFETGKVVLSKHPETGEPGTFLILFPKPTWTYDKAEAHAGELGQIQDAKKKAEFAGYKDLVIEPIDDFKVPIPPIKEVVH